MAIATPIPEIELPRLQQLVMRYAQDSGGRVSILNTLGEVLADSEQPIASIANQLDATEVRAALAGHEQSDVRFDSLSGVETLFAAAPIQQGATLLGVVQLSKPMSAVTADVRGLLLNLALATVAALSLFVLLAIGVARSLVRPVRTMEAVARLVAAGDLSQQAPVTSADELGALATAFNHMIRELGTLLEQQRAFVANASHELRTPLTNIKLRVEAVRSLGVEDLALSERYLREVESEADRMARMAADLLDLAHLERRAAPRTLSPIDLTPVLHNAATMMSLRAERAGLVLLRQLPPSLPAVAVDPGEIEEAVINLLDNSLKYTPAGGQVTLRSSVESGQLLLQVQDTGPGIPAEDLPRIFDRFYRVDKVRSRRRSDATGLGSGAGLGLSITRMLVRQNGGDILAVSTPGVLTTFTIVLPTATVA
jgi:signal transduction histidine kinase